MAELASKQDTELLEKVTDGRAAQWWCVLNSWGWPKELPDPEPRPRRCRDMPRRNALMFAIEKRLGMDRCLAEWNSGAAEWQAESAQTQTPLVADDAQTQDP